MRYAKERAPKFEGKKILTNDKNSFCKGHVNQFNSNSIYYRSLVFCGSILKNSEQKHRLFCSEIIDLGAPFNKTTL